MSAAEDPANLTLIVTLELAVPLRMFELAAMSNWRREQAITKWADEAASDVGSRGDALMFRSETKARRHGLCANCGRDVSQDRDGWYHIGNEGREFCCADGRTPSLAGSPETGSAAAFNALARGLAAAAWQPGGITFLGAHWCALGCADCPRRAS